MKRIYFIHASSFDYRDEYYLPIQQCGLSNKYELIFPHIDSEKPFASKDLFKSGECDLVVAEVSYPTTGGGIEIGVGPHNI
jgi:hypothetical protein